MNENDKLLKDIAVELKTELKEPEPTGIKRGIASILLGIVGIILHPFIGVICGALGGALAISANKYGQRMLGAVGGLAALANLTVVFFQLMILF